MDCPGNYSDGAVGGYDVTVRKGEGVVVRGWGEGGARYRGSSEHL